MTLALYVIVLSAVVAILDGLGDDSRMGCSRLSSAFETAAIAITALSLDLLGLVTVFWKCCIA